MTRCIEYRFFCVLCNIITFSYLFLLPYFFRSHFLKNSVSPMHLSSKTKRHHTIHRKGGIRSQRTPSKKRTRSHPKMSRQRRGMHHGSMLKSIIVIADDTGGWWPTRPEQADVYKRYRRDHWPEENDRPNDSFPKDVRYDVHSGKYYIGLKYENAYQGGQGQHPRTIMIQDRTGEHQWREINSLFHFLQRTPSIKRKINTS